ncbi:hypothetical protein [Devosia salina]|uniref:Uncharacterized protein n=1 Tax=Devosia salina TaxID=2860336 RepID=A0ABX8WBZ9_9HYPH|nr:hypothetical protein [Devosia salina]QYO75619.1 hypothetical protein K1X15_13365 [Devosia salina]
MFLHVQTTVDRVIIEGDDCNVSATIETLKRTRGAMFPGPSIDFTLTMPACEIEDAYDRAIEEGRRIFERFNAKQEAA